MALHPLDEVPMHITYTSTIQRHRWQGARGLPEQVDYRTAH